MQLETINVRRHSGYETARTRYLFGHHESALSRVTANRRAQEARGLEEIRRSRGETKRKIENYVGELRNST